MRLGIVSHAADLLVHEQAENGVRKIQQRFAAAKVFSERNDLAIFSVPVLRVVAEDFWVGKAETIDALLYVADEKTVCLRAIT